MVIAAYNKVHGELMTDPKACCAGGSRRVWLSPRGGSDCSAARITMGQRKKSGAPAQAGLDLLILGPRGRLGSGPGRGGRAAARSPRR